jgi:hypothetical protein
MCWPIKPLQKTDDSLVLQYLLNTLVIEDFIIQLEGLIEEG